MQTLRAAKHSGQSLKRDANDIVFRLLRRQSAAGRLRVKAKAPGTFIFRFETLFHELGPESARGSEFGDLLEKVIVDVEKETESAGELIHIEPALDRRLHVGEAISERERDFLNSRASGFSDMVARYGDRVPVRNLAGAIVENVGDDSHRCFGRINVGAASDVFLEQIILNCASELARADPASFCDRDVESEENSRG